MVIEGDQTFIKKRRRLESNNESVNKENNDAEDNMTRKYGIGAKLLLKMGYKKGEGLGKNGSGISEPIEPEKRPVANAGLGSIPVASIDEDGSESYNSSSEDEITHPKSQDNVTFEKRSVTNTNEEISQLEKLAEDLRLYSNICPAVDTSRLDSKGRANFELLGPKLLETERQLKSLEHRIALLEPELTSIAKKEANLKKLLGSEQESFEIRVKKILSDFGSDVELIDVLISDLLYSTFKTSWCNWDPLDDKNKVLKEIQPLLSNFRFESYDSSQNYNRTQTIIYRNVIEKLIPFWKDFELSKDRVNLIIHLTLEYQPTLKFMRCDKYLFEKYISGKLIDALQKWHPDEDCHQDKLSPSIWYWDLSILISDETLKKFGRIIESKLYEYFHTWHHKTSNPIRNADLIFIKEVLTQDRFISMSKSYFLPKFIDQLWDNYFDPLVELENPSSESPSLYYYQNLQEYKLFFQDEDYQILVSAAFNELNKILYQWLLYADEQDIPRAQWWFNKFINAMFTHIDPVPMELREIKKSLHFLQDSNAVFDPIHNDRLDLRSELNLIERDEKYNVRSIPAGRIVCTLKDVIEDFCEQHGFVLEKTDRSIQLPQSSNQNTLVPVFKIHTGIKIHNIAINNDILWTDKGNDLFVPTYLYELAP